jgi:hypothetical protein
MADVYRGRTDLPIPPGHHLEHLLNIGSKLALIVLDDHDIIATAIHNALRNTLSLNLSQFVAVQKKRRV